MNTILAIVDTMDVALFGIFLFVIILALVGFLVFSIWLNRVHDSPSPYSGASMRRGSVIPYDAAVRVLRFLYDKHQYDNRIFSLRRSAICRETGRIFPDAVTWYDKIQIDWTFLQKRFPGNYVSWGSLTEDQQEIVISRHDSLKGFQLEISSPHPQPKIFKEEHVYAKPGPLYVDFDTGVLLGWQCVPETDLEVLIVQKPVVTITPTVT